MKAKRQQLRRVKLSLLLFCGLFVAVCSTFAQTWTQTSAPGGNWFSVASSADGTKLLAGMILSGGIYISTNSGTAWAQTSVPQGDWASVASSADGIKLAVAGETSIYTSPDSGATWISNDVPMLPWMSIASSADGNTLVVANNHIGLQGGVIYTSTNAGAAWTQASVPAKRWQSVASSADGTKMAAAIEFVTGTMGGRPDGLIYTSTNSGATWAPSTAPSNNWQSVASSADGTKLVAGVLRGGIYTSTDSGTTWTQTSAPNQYWFRVASSADGNMLIAACNNYGNGGPIYTSTNSGSTWTLNNAPITSWTSVASSADGNEMLASAAPMSQGAGDFIYTAQITPSPSMNITPTNGNLTVSWIVPSTNFVMQQSPDLQSWADMTNQPALNLTNLQNEVIFQPPGSNVFYRLKTP